MGDVTGVLEEGAGGGQQIVRPVVKRTRIVAGEAALGIYFNTEATEFAEGNFSETSVLSVFKPYFREPAA